MGRLSIRVKLTLTFVLAMALVLGATGLFVYLRMDAELDRSVDQSLRSRSGDITALIKQADQGLAQAGRSPLAQQGEGFAQILDSGRHIVDSTQQVRAHPLLSGAQLARAQRGTIFLSRDRQPGFGEPARLLATPVNAQDQRLVVVVGASTGNQSQALSNLVTQLLLGGAVALVLASLGAYGVAAAALRPVESMRRRAAVISAGDPGQRLPLPPSRDEISRLGETLNAMLARLEEAFARERTFVADASHELRTPLAILTTELDLALRRGRSPQELTAALRSAAEETDRLSQLAEDLLVIARSDQGRLPVSPTEVELEALLGTVSNRFRERAAAAVRTITVTGDGPRTLMADRLRIEQALGNMVDNALRHGSGPIELAARRANSAVELHVLDEGPGFPAPFVATAFERFSRGDGGRAGGGTGLGLAIVAAIAEAHGGNARAANRPEGGADVWIAVPGRR